MANYFICGGAGFIASHLIADIFRSEKDARVVVFDNLTSGKMSYLEEARKNRGFEFINADIKQLDILVKAMHGAEFIYHFASNPDIARSAAEPDIDFWEGTYLTNNILEAMRKNGVRKIIYASGSGVYGDTGILEVNENYAPLVPVSTYGASKLSGEALISAYCHMFEMQACIFRFANVVGARQTHGVGLDFIRKLIKTPKQLEILGDGSQSKSYIHVEDAIKAMRLLQDKMPENFSCYNVATLDYLTVKEIADIAVEVMGLEGVKYTYTGGRRGWKGDVPIVRLNSDKIRKEGWSNAYTSQEAVRLSLKALYTELKKEIS
jgi:UDP-glucose 4-epimerase